MKQTTQMNKTKNLILSALCVAIGITLPMVFHSIPNSGSIFLPMHIPVLLCGLICGWPYGLACGILTPLASNLITGMPPMAILPSMLCELAVYGLISGILYSCVHTNKKNLDIYISLIIAMMGGRVIYGLLNSFIFMAGKYSMQLWLAAAFITSFPGIIIQLILIPIIVISLQKANLIPKKY